MMATTRKRLADGSVVTLSSYVCGRYRLELSPGKFGQITRHGRTWHAEIRDTETSAIIRHAGDWTSLREACAELVDIQRGITAPLHLRRAFTSAHIDADCKA